MKDPIITYRGASSPASELYNERTSQLQQQQGTRTIEYRGVTAEIDLNQKEQPRKRTVTYRGATLETEF
ncbi:MAG: hypothetical protein P1V20_18835 [Verrucomicrobiales bacterium]|nr:hypothetical protein [Verrucomicrobiales bacterium]